MYSKCVCTTVSTIMLSSASDSEFRGLVKSCIGQSLTWSIVAPSSENEGARTETCWCRLCSKFPTTISHLYFWTARSALLYPFPTWNCKQMRLKPKSNVTSPWLWELELVPESIHRLHFEFCALIVLIWGRKSLILQPRDRTLLAIGDSAHSCNFATYSSTDRKGLVYSRFSSITFFRSDSADWSLLPWLIAMSSRTENTANS